MAKLTEKQKTFINEYLKMDKGVNIESVVKALVYSYITAEKESEKEYAAWLICRIKPNITIIGMNEVIDIKELCNYAKTKQSKISLLRRATQKRRHQKRNDFALTNEEWQEAIEYFNYSCAYCGEDNKLTYEHFIPFSKGGGFTKENIIPVCQRCNSSKCDSDFFEWFKRQDFYLETREHSVLEYINHHKAR